MPKNVLIVASTRAVADVREILRIQDTLSVLHERGWFVDIAVSGDSPLLSAAVNGRARIIPVSRLGLPPNLPMRASFRRFLCAIPLFFRAVTLLSRKNYSLVHGLGDGAIVAHFLNRFTVNRHPFIAEILIPFSALPKRGNPAHPIACFLEHRAMRRAAAVVIPAFDTLDSCTRPIPKARIAVIPDPRAEIYPESFTSAEYATAIENVYGYSTRSGDQ